MLNFPLILVLVKLPEICHMKKNVFRATHGRKKQEQVVVVFFIMCLEKKAEMLRIKLKSNVEKLSTF